MNTKKPKPPGRLLSETVVELKTDYKTAVQRLQELNGFTHKRDASGKEREFISNKKGFFTFANNGRNERRDPHTSLIRAKGSLYVEEGKTKAVVYIHRSSLSAFVVGCLVFVEFFFFLLILQYALSGADPKGWLLLAIYSIGLAVYLAYLFSNRHKSVLGMNEDAQMLKQDALSRLEAVDKWDE